MGCLANSVVVLAFAPFFVALLVAGLSFLVGIPDWAAFQWVGIGILVYLPIHLLLSGNFIPFFGSLEHELCHVAMRYAFLGNVRSLEANVDRNSMTVGTPGNFMISLAPYFLPLFTLPLLFIRALASPQMAPYVDIAIGMTLTFHYARVLRNLLVPQTDFGHAGPIASPLVTISMNVLFLALIAAIILADYQGLVNMFREAWRLGLEYYRITLDWVNRAIDSVMG